MKSYPLTVVTPDGCLFDGQAVRLVCRTITGDVAILAGHCDFCTALGMGEAHIVTPDDQTRRSTDCSTCEKSHQGSQDPDQLKPEKADQKSHNNSCGQRSIRRLGSGCRQKLPWLSIQNLV